MNDEDELRAQVMKELLEIRQRITELEMVSETKRKHVEKCWAEVIALLANPVGASKDRE